MPASVNIHTKEQGKITLLPVHTNVHPAKEKQVVNRRKPVNGNQDGVNGSKKHVVEQCLVNHPELNNAEIIRLVKAQSGLTVGPAYVSMIRTGKRA